MSKLVILELDGDFDRQGFRVTLDIGSDSDYSQARMETLPRIQQAIKIKGYLPANPELAANLQHHWLENYRSLGAPTRIKSKKIIHKGSINQRIKQCREWQQLRGNERRQFQIPLITSVVVTFLIIGMRSIGLFQAWELQAFDQLMRLRSHEKVDPRLLVVTVTEKDVQNQNRQQRRGASLSDDALAKLLNKLELYQPRVIGLDIYRDFPVNPDYKHLKIQFQKNQRLISVCEVGVSDKNPGIRPPAEVPEDRLSFSDFPVDSDGVIRRQLLGMAKNPTSFCGTDTSFSLRVAQLYLASKGIESRRNSQGNLQIGDVVFEKLKPNSGGYHQVDALGYQILLNYRASHSVAQQITLTEILSNQNDSKLANLIKGRIILIGTTAESFKDYFYTPYSAGQWSEKMPGVLIHTHNLSRIVRN